MWAPTLPADAARASEVSLAARACVVLFRRRFARTGKEIEGRTSHAESLTPKPAGSHLPRAELCSRESGTGTRVQAGLKPADEAVEENSEACRE